MKKKIYYIFDAPHLLKSVRNNLRKHSFQFEGKIAKWAYMKQFYNKKSQQKFKLAPKLTKNHIFICFHINE